MQGRLISSTLAAAAVLDSILWHYRHGFDSTPPPPGPNASGRDG